MCSGDVFFTTLNPPKKTQVSPPRTIRYVTVPPISFLEIVEEISAGGVRKRGTNSFDWGVSGDAFGQSGVMFFFFLGCLIYIMEWSPKTIWLLSEFLVAGPPRRGAHSCHSGFFFSN